MKLTPRNPFGTFPLGQMVPCQEYALASTAEREGGASASTTEAAAKGLQPFEVEVERASCLVMDLHAHLCHHEIIGFLGGAWDPHTRKLTVQRAFPVRQLVRFLAWPRSPRCELRRDVKQATRLIEQLIE